MAVTVKYLEHAEWTALDDRLLLDAMLADAGVANYTDLVATVSNSAGWIFAVSAGDLFLPSAGEGVYHLHSSASELVDLDAPHPTLDRVDLIVAQVRDEEHTGIVGTNDGLISKITGTPGGGVPATPRDTFALYQVAVPGGAGGATAGALTRVAAVCRFVGVPTARASTARPPARPGQINYDEDRKTLTLVNAAGAWVDPIGSPTKWRIINSANATVHGVGDTATWEFQTIVVPRDSWLYVDVQGWLTVDPDIQVGFQVYDDNSYDGLGPRPQGSMPDVRVQSGGNHEFPYRGIVAFYVRKGNHLISVRATVKSGTGTLGAFEWRAHVDLANAGQTA